MTFRTRVITVLSLLALTATAFAQEADAATTEAPVVPQGLGLLMILLGVTAILVVGFVMWTRESGDNDNLI